MHVLELRLVVRSVLFTLHPPDLRGGKSVLTQRLIIKFTCVVCKHDGNVDLWIRICDPCPNFTFICLYSTGIDECQATVQKVIASQKSKKSKRISAYDWYKFSLCGMHKLVQVRNWCRNVWIMPFSYTYIIVNGSFLFSGFNRFPHFISPTTVYKC